MQLDTQLLHNGLRNFRRRCTKTFGFSEGERDLWSAGSHVAVLEVERVYTSHRRGAFHKCV